MQYVIICLLLGQRSYANPIMLMKHFLMQGIVDEGKIIIIFPQNFAVTHILLIFCTLKKDNFKNLLGIIIMIIYV